MTIDLPRRMLDVGGSRGNRPRYFDGFGHVLLDLDASTQPDIVADARELATSQAAGEFDAAYCAHVLQRYYKHDALKVMRGIAHVLKPDGFAEFRVRDIEAIAKVMVEQRLDFEAVLYTSPAGPVTVRDAIYGHAGEIERSGSDWFAHKTGFTQPSLSKQLNACGFPYVFAGTGNYEVVAYAFKTLPTPSTRALLMIPDSAVEAARRIVGG